ncbi:MAG TPA: FKBP-type peptidyl-prolyl cis-trans isomerase [Chitinophagaceae bacterium]|nr:FKBP-type peptidyl-prolyl cis-trans isomerase [Chitinophagaceae bacterium]
MKKTVLFSILSANLVNLYAQPGVKPVPSPLKNLDDSASYAVGIGVGNFYKLQGVAKLNTQLVSKGIRDQLEHKALWLEESTCNMVLNEYLNSLNKPPKPPVKPTTAQPVKTLYDSACYAIGISVADFYGDQGITKLNTILVSKGISDILGNKKPLCDANTVNNVLNNYINKALMEKSKVHITAGEEFLAKNKLRPEVKTTTSGLQYEVLREGTGEKPVATDSVTCNYAGTLLDGFEFDNSYRRGRPPTFALNRVIKGWTEGLQLMSVGSKFKFYIPYLLAYGPYDNGQIPGGATLIFEVELLDVKKN